MQKGLTGKNTLRTLALAITLACVTPLLSAAEIKGTLKPGLAHAVIEGFVDLQGSAFADLVGRWVVLVHGGSSLQGFGMLLRMSSSSDSESLR